MEVTEFLFDRRKNTITEDWDLARKMLKEGKRNEANELLHWGIIKIAEANRQKQKEIDGLPVDLWVERFWTRLENEGFMED
jgi:hypothetical protein